MQPGLGAHRSSKGKWGIALGHRAHLKIVATQCPEACGDGFQSEARPLSAPHVPHLLGLPAAPATGNQEETTVLQGSLATQVK